MRSTAVGMCVGACLLAAGGLGGYGIGSGLRNTELPGPNPGPAPKLDDLSNKLDAIERALLKSTDQATGAVPTRPRAERLPDRDSRDDNTAQLIAKIDECLSKIKVLSASLEELSLERP